MMPDTALDHGVENTAVPTPADPYSASCAPMLNGCVRGVPQ